MLQGLAMPPGLAAGRLAQLLHDAAEHSGVQLATGRQMSKVAAKAALGTDMQPASGTTMTKPCRL